MSRLSSSMSFLSCFTVLICSFSCSTLPDSYIKAEKPSLGYAFRFMPPSTRAFRIVATPSSALRFSSMPIRRFFFLEDAIRFLSSSCFFTSSWSARRFLSFSMSSKFLLAKNFAEDSTYLRPSPVVEGRANMVASFKIRRVFGYVI